MKNKTNKTKKPTVIFKDLKIKDLKFAEYNPRKMSDREMEKLKLSIGEFGMVEPVVVNKDMTIIGGHQRVRACQELGRDIVPARIVDLSKQKEKALNLALNKITGSFDDILLAQLLDEIEEQYRQYTGFEDKEITALLDTLKDEDLEDDFCIEPPKKSNIKQGEMFQLGEHRLMCGDATSADDVNKLMGKDKVEMVFTDPPYNVDYTGGMGDDKKHRREGIMNDKMSKENFYQFLERATKNMLNTCIGGIYICMSSTELDTLKTAFENNGGHFQSFVIWVKNAFTLSRADWQNQYEPILYGWSKKVKDHYFVGHRDEANVWQNLEKLKPKIDDDGKMIIKLGEYHLKLDQTVTGQVCIKKECTDIWREKKPNINLEHPTMKPVKLVVKAIKASSKRNGIVQDLFGGSGTTMIACEKMNRKCRMMELDPRYCEVIIKRWEKLTNNKAKKL